MLVFVVFKSKFAVNNLSAKVANVVNNFSFVGWVMSHLDVKIKRVGISIFGTAYVTHHRHGFERLVFGGCVFFAGLFSFEKPIATGIWTWSLELAEHPMALHFVVTGDKVVTARTFYRFFRISFSLPAAAMIFVLVLVTKD
jgi:hypothetical protein